MVDSEHLTYRDCPYYTRVSYMDESQSVCNITGKLCDADEAGLECSMWEEEKLAMLVEEEAQRLYAERTNNKEHSGYEVSNDVREGRQFKYYHYSMDCCDPCCMCHVKGEDV